MLVITEGILLITYVILGLALACSQIKASGAAKAHAFPHRASVRKF